MGGFQKHREKGPGMASGRRKGKELACTTQEIPFEKM